MNKRYILSELAKRTASVSAAGVPSDISAAVFHTQDRSDPMFGCNTISAVTIVHKDHRQSIFQTPITQRGKSQMEDVLRWLAQTLSVLSRRMTRRTFPVSLCLSRRSSPVPRSFHSEPTASKRQSLA